VRLEEAAVPALPAMYITPHPPHCRHYAWYPVGYYMFLFGLFAVVVLVVPYYSAVTTHIHLLHNCQLPSAFIFVCSDKFITVLGCGLVTTALVLYYLVPNSYFLGGHACLRACYGIAYTFSVEIPSQCVLLPSWKWRFRLIRGCVCCTLGMRYYAGTRIRLLLHPVCMPVLSE